MELSIVPNVEESVIVLNVLKDGTLERQGRKFRLHALFVAETAIAKLA